MPLNKASAAADAIEQDHLCIRNYRYIHTPFYPIMR